MGLTDYASGKLDQLCLCDEFLERVVVAHRCVEIMAVHHAVDDTIDEASESLRASKVTKII